MSSPVIGYCVRCANDLTAAELAACACPKDGLVERERIGQCPNCGERNWRDDMGIRDCQTCGYQP